MDYSEEIAAQAEHFAVQAHEGQKYGADEDYIAHPRRVASALIPPVLKIIAFLHDTVEDNATVTLTEIAAYFGGEVSDAVDALTRRPLESYQNDYLPRVCKNKLAIQVKKADLQDNLREAIRKQGQYARLIPRYQKALLFIEEYQKSILSFN